MLIRFEFRKNICKSSKRNALFDADGLEPPIMYRYNFEILSIDPAFCTFLKSLSKDEKKDSELIHIDFKEKKISSRRLNKSRISIDQFSFIFLPTGRTYNTRISKDINFFRFGLTKSEFISVYANIDELFIKSMAIITNMYKQSLD